MKLCFNSLMLTLLLTTSFTQASEIGGITVGGTRLIYNGAKKETSLNINNSDVGPYLIQSWVETNNGGIEKAPFIITPPLFRLDAGQQNLLRIVRTGGDLPEDRESLFWLNIKSIPANTNKSDDNTLQIAVKTKIKLIYRPQDLKGTPEDVTKSLVWTQKGNKLSVMNPTAYYMNFNLIRLGGHELKGVTFVAPKSYATFDALGSSGTVTWKLITDFGGTGPEHSAAL